MGRMRPAKCRRLLPILSILVVALFCTTSLVSSENPVTFANQTYPTLGDFQQSETFKELGSRCGTPPPSRYEFISAFRALSDCNESQSDNLSDYPPSTVYTIPVWVHIIMDDSCTDGAISDELVASQIEILNEDFRALTGTPGEDGTDVMLQFCLAGINRVCNDDYFDECFFENCNIVGDQNKNETYKNDLNADPVYNLNIYTKRWPDYSGLLGYATWPWEDAGQPRDGVAINWQNFGRNSSSGPPYDQGRTTTHEIGHYLGLLHTFQSWCTAGNVGSGCSEDSHCDTSWGADDGVCETCGGDTSPGCYSKPGGDFICDTNPEEFWNFGCDETAATCGSSDPIHNYMNYTDDTCMEEFTPEQTERIICTILNYRAELPGHCGQLPTADANGPYSAVCQGATTEIQLDGSGSSDPDGDHLTYAWTTDCPGGSFDDATSVTPMLTVDASPGCLTCNVSLNVDDGFGGTDTSTSSVTITDTLPPVIQNLTVNPNDLWPPNHKMVQVTVAATATDSCDPSPDCIISGISSNEPVNDLGDGDMTPDWNFTGGLTVDLRAERSGTGDGRIYTIEVTCTDDCENSVTDTTSVSVVVEHNR